MKAVCWNGKHDVRVETVPDPKLLNPRDAIVKIASTAICGSDLHLYDGLIPTMMRGDVLGHEFMGEIVELGKGVSNLQVGDRVVVPFTIACGNCNCCKRDLWSLWDNSNPNKELAEKMYGYSGAGYFGYSHIFGGYAGGQAEYARVPYADSGPIKVPERLSDEQVLFLSDIFPTGYQAVEACDIKPGDTVAIWGCGPVGQFAIRSAVMLGAERVLAIDEIPERLKMAEASGAETLNFSDEDLQAKIKDITFGRGPEACIDAVGMEAHGTAPGMIYDYAKQAMRMQVDRPNVLRQAIMACGKGGTVSIPGVYAGLMDKLPFHAAWAKGLTFKMGQTHTQRYLKPLLERVEQGDIDPSFVITHTLPLEEAPHGYDIFRNKKDDCIKIVLKPGQS